MASSTASLFPLFTLDPPLNPPLKWAGGKRWLVPRLRELYEPHAHRRLVEPFTGGIAVALGLRPEHALLSDISPHLINFYRHLQNGFKATREAANDQAHFYAARDRFNALLSVGQHDTHEAAELFYYLNRTCFNGLCRFNSKGGFNVPFGSYKKINYRQDFEAYADVFGGWDFHLGDFETLEVEADDFIYADPPYDTPFTKYAKEDFNWDDQQRLVHWLANHSGPVVASNQATERILELYRTHGFTVETTKAPRRISCTGDRTPALEMLATKGV
jgi:DNA adenine methylase